MKALNSNKTLLVDKSLFTPISKLHLGNALCIKNQWKADQTDLHVMENKALMSWHSKSNEQLWLMIVALSWPMQQNSNFIRVQPYFSVSIQKYNTIATTNSLNLSELILVLFHSHLRYKQFFEVPRVVFYIIMFDCIGIYFMFSWPFVIWFFDPSHFLSSKRV